MRELDNTRSLLQKEDSEQKTRVVVMLGSRMFDPKGNEDWQFPLFTPNQTNVGTSLPGEVSGGWSRMRAVQSEYQKDKRESPHEKMVVLVTGGKESSGQSRSIEAARELVKRYGLAPDSVESIGGRGATLGNAAATVEYIFAHEKTLGNVKDIDLVTNDYHMLRAWIMFSQGMLERTTNKKLEVSPDDKERIKSILDDDLPVAETLVEEKVRETRDKIISILKPYFSVAKIHVTPTVVEETLERDVPVNSAKARYSRMLRNNHWVRETIRFEYQGIKDLLDGKYRGR